MKNGEEVIVTVDDYFPCYYSPDDKTPKEPVFARHNGNELWVMLLEKAYAKLHGNYWQLDTGFIAHSLSDLTGAPVKRKLLISMNNFNFLEYKCTNPKVTSVFKIYLMQVWLEMHRAQERGHVM